MTAYANNLLEAMDGFGYGMEDLLSAFPGRNIDYVTQVQRDNSNALSRPVIPYGLLGAHQCSSRYFNVGEHGMRLSQIPQAWPPTTAQTNIFVFGGSTVVGYYVEDAHTIPSLLQEKLRNDNFAVYNLGGGNYTSRMAVLRFLLALENKFIPHIAIFLDGYNDCFYALADPPIVGVLDQLYQEEKRRRRLSFPKAVLDYLISSGRARQRPLPNVLNYRAAEIDAMTDNLLDVMGVQNALRNSEMEISLSDLPAHQQILAEQIWSRYMDNVALSRAIAARHKIKTLFAWQPTPYFKTMKRHRILEDLYPAFGHGAICSPVYNWLHAKGFPEMADDPNFLDLSDIGGIADEVLYLDVCHYTPHMAAMIADKIAAFVLEHKEPMC